MCFPFVCHFRYCRIFCAIKQYRRRILVTKCDVCHSLIIRHIVKQVRIQTSVYLSIHACTQTKTHTHKSSENTFSIRLKFCMAFGKRQWWIVAQSFIYPNVSFGMILFPFVRFIHDASAHSPIFYMCKHFDTLISMVEPAKNNISFWWIRIICGAIFWVDSSQYFTVMCLFYFE